MTSNLHCTFNNSLNIRDMSQNVVHTFENHFKKEPDDPLPSSYWDENMVMLNDEELPLDMRLYSEWNEYADRTIGQWFWHAPSRVFRLPNESQFLLAQKNKDWIVYDRNDQKVKMTTTQKIYNNILEAITSCQ